MKAIFAYLKSIPGKELGARADSARWGQLNAPYFVALKVPIHVNSKIIFEFTWMGISKGFYETIKDLQPDAKYVITPSGERFDRSDGLRICPLDLFLSEELALLG